ncbi:MAG: cobyrinate a,c-diamide synthase [Chromatiales bacterium]|nr:cobyrinate a,c-diamide synthase [Chromatiales bacterium]
MGRLLISATHKSSGKTIISTALAAILKARRLNPRPYKKGPDYIDPQWLSAAAGCPCYNLDFNVQSKDEIVAMVADKSPTGSFTLIEANKGLYDGVSVDGSNSNAALTKLLRCPVLLVVDCDGMTRGIAPLLLGYSDFDPELTIGGVILNRVGGTRHQSKLIAAVEQYTDIPVMGTVMKDKTLLLPERHLGLIPANEASDKMRFIEAIAERIVAQLDIEKIIELAALTAPLPKIASRQRGHRKPTADIRIGVFKDAAFGFYYPDDLEALEQLGAELLFIDSLSDARLPATDGLFIGGGFPETQADVLEANRPLRTAVAEAIEGGIPVYAECGGLMYLTRGIHWQGRRFEMCGVIDADTYVDKVPQGRGYVELIADNTISRRQLGDNDQPATIYAHEFHYSRLIDIKSDYQTAYKVNRGVGLGNGRDGIIYKNLLAMYAHQRNVCGDWARIFSDLVRQHKKTPATAFV